MDSTKKSLPTSKRTIQDMLGYFTNIDNSTTTILPKERMRYVIYLRRSTDDPKRQVRSLKDQKRECLTLARTLGIPNIREEDILTEKFSAMKSGKRDIFNEMVRGFKSGKYQGLISWSPDRLSRNMKDAGEIIELIDDSLIQDLHFKTYQFDNTPNGKMLLGILFATSKQYSDRLSVDAKRGISGNVKEGKYNGSTKKGYAIDPGTGYFMPDAENWQLIRKAFEMHIYENKSNVEIAQFMNEVGLRSKKYIDDKEYKMIKVTNKIVGDIFADKFYMGIYHFGNTITDLTEIYNFMPIITPDEYIAANKELSLVFDKNLSGGSTKPAILDYGLLRHKVICDYCDNEMQFQHQPIRSGDNKGKYLVSFYCRNKKCKRHDVDNNKKDGLILKKSIRAKYILAAIEWTLRNMTNHSKEAYSTYIESISFMHEQNLAIARRKHLDSKQEVIEAKTELRTYQSFQVNKTEDYEKFHKGKLEECQAYLDLAISREEQAKANLDKLSVSLPSEQEFYELVDSYLLKLLNATNIVEQDAICNELVSNLRAGDDSISVITLNPPYNLMVDYEKLSLGWG